MTKSVSENPQQHFYNVVSFVAQPMTHRHLATFSTSGVTLHPGPGGVSGAGRVAPAAGDISAPTHGSTRPSTSPHARPLVCEVSSLVCWGDRVHYGFLRGWKVGLILLMLSLEIDEGGTQWRVTSRSWVVWGGSQAWNTACQQDGKANCSVNMA